MSMNIFPTNTKMLQRNEELICLEAVLGRNPDDALIDYHVDLGFQNAIDFGNYLKGTEEYRNNPANFVMPPRRQSLFLGDRLLAYTLAGDRIFLLPQDQDLTIPILETGRWEPWVESAIKRLVHAGDRVIEAGANVGYHTLTLARQIGPSGVLHAFEVNPLVMKLLRATMFQNGFSNHFGIGMTTLHQKALADREGELILQVAPDHFGSGHLISGQDGSDFGVKYSEHFVVEAVSANNYLPNLDTIDFIHLDIEGAEPLAIMGADALIARSPQVRIVAEWAVGMMRVTGSLDDMVAMLIARGFRFWVINADSSGFTPVADNDVLNLPPCDVLISRIDPD